jgi:hypothetical protein
MFVGGRILAVPRLSMDGPAASGRRLSRRCSCSSPQSRRFPPMSPASRHPARVPSRAVPNIIRSPRRPAGSRARSHHAAHPPLTPPGPGRHVRHALHRGRLCRPVYVQRPGRAAGAPSTEALPRPRPLGPRPRHTPHLPDHSPEPHPQLGLHPRPGPRHGHATQGLRPHRTAGPPHCCSTTTHRAATPAHVGTRTHAPHYPEPPPLTFHPIKQSPWTPAPTVTPTCSRKTSSSGTSTSPSGGSAST